jgi:hypothetical protein
MVLWAVGKPDGPKHPVMLIPSARRSKWYRLVCFCKRRRKDGTCQMTDGIRPLIYASVRERVRLEHPQIDKVLHRIPNPDQRAYLLTHEAAEKVQHG